MEIKASVSYVRESPKKLRLLTRDLRKLSPQKALEKLEFLPYKGKEVLTKLIKQARANAVNNFKLLENDLLIERVEVGEGPRIKRTDKSHGARFDRGIIKKRSSRIWLTLVDKPKEKIEVINSEKEEKNPPSSGKAGLRRTRGTKN